MIRVVIRPDFASGGHCLWIIEHDERTNKTRWAKPINLEFEERSDSYLLREPTLQFDQHQAPLFLRALQDALSEAEIASSKEERRDREMRAVKDHLADSIQVRDKLLTMVIQKDMKFAVVENG